jgi:hypothetical protein
MLQQRKKLSILKDLFRCVFVRKALARCIPSGFTLLLQPLLNIFLQFRCGLDIVNCYLFTVEGINRIVRRTVNIMTARE